MGERVAGRVRHGPGADGFPGRASENNLRSPVVEAPSVAALVPIAGSRPPGVCKAKNKPGSPTSVRASDPYSGGRAHRRRLGGRVARMSTGCMPHTAIGARMQTSAHACRSSAHPRRSMPAAASNLRVARRRRSPAPMSRTSCFEMPPTVCIAAGRGSTNRQAKRSPPWIGRLVQPPDWPVVCAHSANIGPDSGGHQSAGHAATCRANSAIGR